MPDLEIIGGNPGSLQLSASDLKQLTKWPEPLIEDYLNQSRAIGLIIQTLDGRFGTMALQNADDVAITGGTISGVTLDDVTIEDVTVVNLTAENAYTANLSNTGLAHLHDVTVTGYFHSQGITDDATVEQINITDSLVDIHQNTDLGEAIEVTYVTFDGTNDYMLRGAALTGAVNGKFGTIAARIRVSGSGNRDIFNGNNLGGAVVKFQLAQPTGYILVRMDNAAGTNNPVEIHSNSVYPGSSDWLNILISWDCLNDTEGQLYINDISDYDTVNSDLDNEAIAYATCTNWGIGAEPFGFAAKYAGDMAFLYVNFDTAIDFSIEANRRLFFDASGVPVDLGPTGAIPTGTAPIMYFNGDSSEFPTNKGTGGGMTLTGNIDGASEQFGVLHIRDTGYYTDSATGGDMGAETFNALNYYVNAVIVPTISSADELTNKIINIDLNTLTANSPAAGQIPIYSAALSRFDNALITAGVGISVTNADASITLATTTANEATDTTCFPLFVTASGTQTLQPKNNTTLTFNSNTSILGAGSYNVTGTALPANGLNLPAASTLGFVVNSTEELRLTATALSPTTDGGNSLGTTTLGWQNLHSNTGFVWNIENGNWVATHTSAVLTIGTGDLQITTAGTAATSVLNRTGTQTVTGKTISADNNTITSTAASGTVLTSTGSGTAATFQSPAAAATVTVADAASDPTTFVLLAGGATGSQPVLSDAGITFDASTNVMTLTGGIAISSVNGVDCNPGSDIDTDIITVGVTGTPRLLWDESEDMFSLTRGLQSTLVSAPFIIGNTGSLVGTAGITPKMQLVGVNATTSSMANMTFSATPTTASQYQFLKSANGTSGVHTLVADGETVGIIAFGGSDGVAFQRTASISSLVNGAPGLNDMPGLLQFATTPDASTSPTTRLIINAPGNFLFGGLTAAQPATNLPRLDVLTLLASGALCASNTVSDATTKQSMLLSVRHLTNAEEVFGVLAGQSNATDNIAHYGGFSSSFNAATRHSFSAAANSTTVTGTEYMRSILNQLNLVGDMYFGDAATLSGTPSAPLHGIDTGAALELLQSTLASSTTAGPTIELYRDGGNSSAGHLGGGIIYSIESSNGTKRTGAQQYVSVDTAANAAEVTSLITTTLSAGASGIRTVTGTGLAVYNAGAAPTGGLIANAVNAPSQYESGRKIGGCVSSKFTNTGNVGAGTDTLESITIVGGMLFNNGDAFHYEASGTFAVSVTTKTLVASFGGTTIISSGALAISGGNWCLEVTVIKDGTDSWRAHAELFTNNAALVATVANIGATALDLDANQTFLVTGASSGVVDNDIVMTDSKLNFNPA